MDCENCRHLTVIGLHDKVPGITRRGRAATIFGRVFSPRRERLATKQPWWRNSGHRCRGHAYPEIQALLLAKLQKARGQSTDMRPYLWPPAPTAPRSTLSARPERHLFLYRWSASLVPSSPPCPSLFRRAVHGTVVRIIHRRTHTQHTCSQAQTDKHTRAQALRHTYTHARACTHTHMKMYRHKSGFDT